MKLREPAGVRATVPPELADGPTVERWAPDMLAAIKRLPLNDPSRGDVIWRAQAVAWSAYHRARRQWARDHGLSAREMVELFARQEALDAGPTV